MTLIMWEDENASNHLYNQVNFYFESGENSNFVRFTKPNRIKGHFTHEPRAVTMKWRLRAKKKVSKGHPKTPPNLCSVVTDPRSVV